MSYKKYIESGGWLADLLKIGDIRESTANEYIKRNLMNATNGPDSTPKGIYSAALAAIAPQNPLISIQGGIISKSSNLNSTNVGSFEIGMFPVTEDEWNGVREWALESEFHFDFYYHIMPPGKCPAYGMTWSDALQWCNAKSIMEGLMPVYVLKGKKEFYCYDDEEAQIVTWDFNANGYRLPSVAEWEWAAMGGIYSNEYTFAGSNELEEVGWYIDNAEEDSHPVGEKEANELGLYDMSGNVWEWCWDSTASLHSHRGGSWFDSASFCEVSYRNYIRPDFRNPNLGLRLARNL